MDRIEFDADVEEGGVIHIPAEYSRELARARKVHVAVTPEESESHTRGQIREPRTLKLMREHPLNAPGIKPLTREELYGRDRK